MIAKNSLILVKLLMINILEKFMLKRIKVMDMELFKDLKNQEESMLDGYIQTCNIIRWI